MILPLPKLYAYLLLSAYDIYLCCLSILTLYINYALTYAIWLYSLTMLSSYACSL